MAKWGQGDPRWIVEERVDGTNVNNGHCTSGCSCAWLQGATGGALVFSSCTGESPNEWDVGCSDNSPGAVLSCLMQFLITHLRICYVNTGTVKESGEKHKGSIEIPNLSEETEVDDTEINVSKKKGEGDILKELMRTEGTTKVREALRDYLKALKTEFTWGMILPTKAAGQDLAAERTMSGSAVQVCCHEVLALTKKGSRAVRGLMIKSQKALTEGTGCSVWRRLGVDLISFCNNPKGSCSEVGVGLFSQQSSLAYGALFIHIVGKLTYTMLFSCQLVQKFSKCPAVIEAEKGGKLLMFNGCVSGEYTELVPGQRVVLKWRCRNWPDEHYATVALNFKGMRAATELQLDCKGVPASYEGSTRQWWKKWYFEDT
ncbi:activator of 90 kDa heat shock protein ATPase homolog 2-like [Cyrtonyx montezumae]|uniref:activator of 90 kDa heat shock protein ATPase homolog 2-like n=1 Tax=Cyrtonyx montezumae TaxID=9017 RepID=UPI0032DAB7E0